MANSKYIRASDGNGEAVRANVVEDRGIDNMQLNVDSVLNFPHDFIASTGTLGDDNRLIHDTVTVFYGHLDGSILMIDSFAPGYTDKGNTENQVVLIKPTTAWADELADIIDNVSASVVVQAEPPEDPFAGMLWYDTDDGSNPIIGNLSIVEKEVPSGTKNGTNTTFTTSQPYVPGSLQVFVNGVNQGPMVTESVPTTGTFVIDAPLAADDLFVNYRFVGNTNTNSSDVVDNFHANATPTANTLLPLDASAKFPVSVVDAPIIRVVKSGNFTSSTSVAWQDTGLKLTLPTAGTWFITCDLRISNGSTLNDYCVLRLYNETTAAAVANSDRLGPYPTAAFQMYVGINEPVTTTTANNIIRVEMKPMVARAYMLISDTTSYSVITARRIA